MLQKVKEIVQTDHRLHWAAAVFVALVLLHLIGLGQFIKDYQALLGTLITGLFGFWTVNKTMRENAANAQMQLRENAANVQKQKDREIEHDRIAVRAAIRAELVVMNKQLTLKLNSWKETEAKNNYVVPKAYDSEPLGRAYRGVIGKIGLLKDQEIEAVVRAYSEYEAMPPLFKFLEEAQRVGNVNIALPNSPYDSAKRSLQATQIYTKLAVERLGGKIEEPINKLLLASAS